jgi:malate synthase
VKFAPVEGAATLFTPAFGDYLTRLHDQLDARAHELRARRLAVLERALKQHVAPSHPPTSEANTGTWRVPPVPDDLKIPGIEISGPCSITSMFINALNPGPEGERAAGDLDDDEDSGGHRLIDTVRSAHNRLAAVNRELTFVDRERNRNYKIADGDLPFFTSRSTASRSTRRSWAPPSRSSTPGALRPTAARASISISRSSKPPPRRAGTVTSST